jgi:hypothetical protein
MVHLLYHAHATTQIDFVLLLETGKELCKFSTFGFNFSKAERLVVIRTMGLSACRRAEREMPLPSPLLPLHSSSSW